MLSGEYKFRIVMALSKLNILTLWRDSISSNNLISKSYLFDANVATVAFLG